MSLDLWKLGSRPATPLVPSAVGALGNVSPGGSPGLRQI